MAFWNAVAQAAQVFGFGQVKVKRCGHCGKGDCLVEVDGVIKCKHCGTVEDEEGNVSTDLSVIDWNQHL